MILTTLSLLAGTAMASTATVDLHFDKPGIEVSPHLYGIFFEEINQAGDGGIYAEQLGNRGFENGGNGTVPRHWKALQGTVNLTDVEPFNAQRKQSLLIGSGAAVENEGFWGISVKKGASYRLIVYTKGQGISVSLESAGKPLAKGTIQASTAWKRTELRLNANDTAAKAHLRFTNESTGSTYLGWASLMPTKTWKKSQLRMDLAEHIDQMRPAFVRFPGGCYVEGQDLGRAFDWKAAIGPAEQRAGKDWRFWGYPSTDALGLHEYLQWCEDLGAAPLFVTNCGMSHSNVAPLLGGMDRYIQDALDAIDYANAPVTSPWGALRAKYGHPKPFGLKYIEIGNENSGPNYEPRYKLIYDAIKRQHPEIITIANTTVPSPMEMIDEHYYSNPGFFWQNSHRYDSYDRKGPKVYVGEYAVTDGCGTGNLAAALGEAAFMTGMERNSDIVKMSSYAPLFVNVNNKQWNPDALVYDAARSYGTPSYWVQRLFSQNRPDRIVPLTLEEQQPPYQVKGGVGLQTWRTQSEFKDLQVTVNGASVPVGDTWNKGAGDWEVADGVIRQKSLAENCRTALEGSPLDGADSYTISVKARKVLGDEGFIVMFQTHGGDFLDWNIGGWGNTQHAFEKSTGGGRSILTPGVTGSVETGRWYDVRIEARGSKIRAFLDGKLIQEVEDKVVPRTAAVAGIDTKRNELVLKLVNAQDTERELTVNLGTKTGSGTATVLTGPSLDAENSFDKPLNVAPITTQIKVNGDRLVYRLPARALAIVRLKLAKPQ